MPLTDKSKYFMPIPDKEMHEPLSSEKLENMSVLAKKQLLIDLDQHQNHLELKRENALEVEKRGGKTAEQEWLTRINYRIGVAKRQKKIIEKYLNAERAERFEKAFVDVAKLVLEEEHYAMIHSRAMSLADIAKKEGVYVSQVP